MAHRKELSKRYVSFRDVLTMMSKDWSVLLIILTIILMLFGGFVAKTGSVTMFSALIK